MYAGLYSRRIDALAAGGATLAGLVLVALEAAGIVKTGAFPAVALNAAVQASLLALLALARGRRRAAAPSWEPERISANASPLWLAAVALVALLGLEPWGFGRPSPLVGGVPAWVWRSAASCVALALVFALWRKPGEGGSRPGP